MDSTGQVVQIRFPGGRAQALTDLVHRAIEKAKETNLPVGLGGHTIICPSTDIEAGPECYICEYEGRGYDQASCQLGVPQNADYSFSKRFVESDQYCEKYKPRDDIKCECGMPNS